MNPRIARRLAGIGAIGVLSATLPDLAAPLAAQSGTLDHSFSGDGILSLAQPVRDLATRIDGAVITTGGDGDYTAGIADDSSYAVSTHGYLSTSDVDTATAGAVLPDGRMLLAGVSQSTDGRTRIYVLRLMPDGSRDGTFSGDGKAVLEEFPAQASWSAASVGGVAITPEGKVVVAGSVLDETEGGPDWFVGRLTASGAVDSSFNYDPYNSLPYPQGNGLRVLNYQDVTALVLQPGGKILVGGTSGSATDTSWRVHRLTADGADDPTWATNGAYFVNSTPRRDRLHAMALGADRGVYLVGDVEIGSSVYSGMVIKLTADGALDTDFSSDGERLVAFAATGTAQLRDALVVPGYPEWLLAAGSDGKRASLVAFRADGTKRSDFGSGGEAHFDLDTTPTDPYWKTMVERLALRGDRLDQAILATESRRVAAQTQPRRRLLAVALE